MSKNLQNLSLFNINPVKVLVKPSEKASKPSEEASKPSEKPSEKASKLDWEQIFQVVKKYIYSKCWDTRLDREDIVQECMIYIFQNLQNSQKEKITPFYVTCFVKNFINRVLNKNGNNGNGKTEDKQGNLFFAVDFEDSEQDLYYRCAKSVFHLETFVSLESLRKI